ncbi:MAG: enoyl-CoA hydratase-related protein [Pseudomonadota bacterium]
MRIGNVEYEKKDGMVIMTLDDQEKLNALSPGIREGLEKGFNMIDADDEVQVGVLTGAGRSFCAGFDITGIELSPSFMKVFFKDILARVLRRAETMIKPVVAAVNGLCLGGGLELAISCDIIIASEKAQFGVPEAKIGLLPGFGIVRLQQIVPRLKAKELIMIGDPIPAEEAFRIGLVNKVVPHDKLMDEAVNMANRILKNPALAMQLAKSAVNRDITNQDIAYATDSFPLLFGTEDAKEGISAFLEKRKPTFKGK